MLLPPPLPPSVPSSWVPGSANPRKKWEEEEEEEG